MNPLKALAEKPWIHQPPDAADVAVRDPLAAARTALYFLLGVVGVLFFLFIITFLSRSQYPDFQALAGAPWQPFSDPSRLWFNTGILACASVAMQWAQAAAGRRRMNMAIAGISGAVFFTLAFLLAQYNLWLYLQGLGFYLAGNPATSYFYLLTAVHGLHLVGGLVVLAYVVFQALGEDADRLHGALRLCATYWHFLFGVWLVLFALLASSPGIINALAALCGF